MGNLTSYADDADGSSGFYSKFGAKIGTGAAKLGKKAAQSEAGRSAGKAAIKGATDGARQDLTDRYLKRGEYGDPGSTPTSPAGSGLYAMCQITLPQELATIHGPLHTPLC